MIKVVIDIALEYTVNAPCTAILMIEPASTPEQTIHTAMIRYGDAASVRRVSADESIGERVLFDCAQTVTAEYHGEITVSRAAPQFESLTVAPLAELPADAQRYLLPSRFCDSERFQTFALKRFGDLSDGKQITAIREWVEAELEYIPGASDGRTTAADTFLDRQGVCRDYAHLMIALCRAVQVPARFCSVYAPSVEPPDFHAVVQVFLSGEWHLIDPTGMAMADEMVLIAVGRDATDVAFMSTTGPAEFKNQSVSVRAADQ